MNIWYIQADSNRAFGHGVVPILYMFELQLPAEAKVTIE